ncbi:uncharacterized protein K444DRAFT_16409 [Hyaloscypha bicolor E]|uniref:Carbohydrate-binding module family 52 protein n=1 Tax=Hyaloscypha bicolor E TaxID=1095630 RepID=A0A2J6TWU8_9HELO|nr:uncharacterized protein K444DRAFT_16409 [Hyaloscypha bicolor E]PMD67475.1 hypothetical protein K444DRAFT_16409 [Hyaloscypha bicolor E]
MYSIPAMATVLALGAQTTYAQNVLATQCYYKSDNEIKTSSGHPCGVVAPNGNFSSCCEIGDTCLADGLCHYTRPEPPPPSVVSRYYMGGCTDESFNAPACNPACTDLDPSDVVYNQTTSNWHCCGQTNGTIHCDDPTTESFQAPAPSALVATYMVPSVVQTAASSTSASTSTSTSTSTSMSTSMIQGSAESHKPESVSELPSPVSPS